MVGNSFINLCRLDSLSLLAIFPPILFHCFLFLPFLSPLCPFLSPFSTYVWSFFYFVFGPSIFTCPLISFSLYFSLCYIFFILNHSFPFFMFYCLHSCFLSLVSLNSLSLITNILHFIILYRCSSSFRLLFHVFQDVNLCSHKQSMKRLKETCLPGYLLSLSFPPFFFLLFSLTSFFSSGKHELWKE